MSVKILKEQRKMCISLACVFGECPLYFSALQNSQNVLRFLFSQSQFDHLRYNSLTLARSQKTASKSTRSYSFIAHSFATQEFPVTVDFIYWFSLHSCQNDHVLFVTQYDNNTFPTCGRQFKFIVVLENRLRAVSYFSLT